MAASLPDRLEASISGSIQSLTPYIPGKPISEFAREYSIEDISSIIKLASNENPLGTSPKVREKLIDIVNTDDFARYPDGSAYDLKSALVKHLNQNRTVSLQPTQLTIGQGSHEVIELVGRLLLQAGDEVIYSQYAFVLYPIVAKIMSATAIEVPVLSDMRQDLAAMAAAVTDKTKLILLANPNNPTGSWHTELEIREFLASVPQHVVVVMDEAYYEYVADLPGCPDSLSYLSEYPNLVVTRSFSKAYGLAGFRVGYGVSHAHFADYLNRIRPAFNIASLSLIAAETALSDQAFVAEARVANAAGYDQITAVLTKLNIRYLPSVGNFILVHFGDQTDRVLEHLNQQGVIVRPVNNYGLPEYLRFSIGTGEENAELINALEIFYE